MEDKKIINAHLSPSEYKKLLFIKMFRATQAGKDISTKETLSIAVNIAYDVVKDQVNEIGFCTI